VPCEPGMYAPTMGRLPRVALIAKATNPIPAAARADRVSVLPRNVKAANATSVSSPAPTGFPCARAMADALAASLPPDRFPNLIGVARSMADLTPDDQFDFELQRLLDGLESLLTGSRA
jgi:hypothetical protein